MPANKMKYIWFYIMQFFMQIHNAVSHDCDYKISYNFESFLWLLNLFQTIF